MKRLHLLLGILLLTAVAATRADALIYQEFPGLDRMIQYSDHVVVAMVLSAPASAPMVPSERPYQVLIVRTLKGPLRPGDAAEIRLVSQMMWPVSTGAAVPEIIHSQYYVLFLGGAGPSLAQLSMPGSIFWIPSYDLPAGQPTDVRSAIAAYLRATIRALEKRRAETDEEIRKYLAPSGK